MKIERLSFQAFGPYIKRQDIDFATLAQRHLFLIQGETGAGKTIILDAITYALYGKSSGGERGDFESMRCRSAKPDVPTFVELIFWIEEKRYRFYRELQMHKKRNGEEIIKMSIDGGSYEEQRYLPFFENCKLKALEEKAEELIGLSHPQFIQVMMLPQGKFEQLLISKSEEKQEILKTLFQVENWEAICANLQEKQRKAKVELETIQQSMSILLAQVNAKTLEELDEQLQQVEQNIKEGSFAQKQAGERLHVLQKQMETQVQLHQIKQRYEQQKIAYQKLLADSERMEVIKQEMLRLEELTQLRPYFQAYKKAEKQVQQRVSVYEQALEKQAALHKQEEQLREQQECLPVWKEQQRMLDQEITRLQEGMSEYEKLKEVQQKEQQLQTKIQQIKQHLQKQRDTKKTGQERLLKIEEQLADCDELLGNYPIWQAQEQLYVSGKVLMQAIQNVQEEHSAEEDKLQQLHHTIEKTQAEFTQVQQSHTRMYEQYMQNSAALLAQLLEEGKPCPVCGSLHHEERIHIQVQQIELSKLQIEKQKVDTLQQQVLEMENEMLQIQKSLANSEKTLRSLTAQIKERLPNGYDAGEHQALQDHLQKAKQASTKRIELIHQQKQIIEALKVIEEQEKGYTETEMKLRQEQVILQTSLQKRNSLLATTYSTLKEVNTALTKAQSDAQTIQQKIDQIEEAVKRFTQENTKNRAQLQFAKQEIEKDTQQLQSSKQEYQERSKGIHYEECDFNFDRMEDKKQEIEAYTKHKMELEASIEELTKQLKNKQLENLEELQANVQAQTESYQVIVQKQAEIENEGKQLKGTKASLLSYRSAYEKKQGIFLRLSDFVKAMRGDNGIGIERYVLGVMLSNITKTANQLLRNVHQGRYQIYRSDETSGRVRKAGLELCIYDAYSCSYRSVVSLSGGEKFLVSLALSLALSTVVQARSGGIRMDCMFIDEGFGSLDERSIDDALSVLMSMSKSKAMIGIISHVEVLKENIPYGIHVHKNQEGSTLKVQL